MEIMAQKAL